jgi:hypothetical protein
VRTGSFGNLQMFWVGGTGDMTSVSRVGFVTTGPSAFAIYASRTRTSDGRPTSLSRVPPTRVFSVRTPIVLPAKPWSCPTVTEPRYCYAKNRRRFARSERAVRLEKYAQSRVMHARTDLNKIFVLKIFSFLNLNLYFCELQYLSF